MTLRDNYKIENGGIWISRKELEEWRDRYVVIVKDIEYNPYVEYYKGKVDLLIDLLKMFEPLEP